MKITEFDDTYTLKLGSGQTTLTSGSSGGSNSAFGGDVVGSAGSLSVVGLRQTVSLASNIGGTVIGDVLTIIQTSPKLAMFATPSNSGGGSFGSNATRVSASSSVGASPNGSREDHRHDGIGTVTASSSNTLDRGTLNLRPGTNVAFALSDSDGSGGFDTVTISASATGGGASGVSSIAKSGSTALTGAVTLTGGTNVTLTQTGNDISIASSGGGGSSGIAHSYAGYNTAGGSTEAMTALKVYAKKITLTSAGMLTSIGAYIDNGTTNDDVINLSVALYSDNAGTPQYIIGHAQTPVNSLLLDTTSGAGGNQNPRWVHLAIGEYLAAGDYWIAVANMDSGGTGSRIYYDGSGSDRTYASGGAWFADWGWYSPTTSANKYSIRASVIDASGTGGSAPSGILPVRDKYTNHGSTNSGSITVTAPTNGNICFLISARDNGSAITSITQTNVTWTVLTTTTAAVAPKIEIWKGVVAASAGTSITVAYADSTFSATHVSEWASTVPVTVSEAKILAGATAPTGNFRKTTTILPTATTALVIGVVTTSSNATRYTPMVGLVNFDAMDSTTDATFMCAYAFPGTVPTKGQSTGGGGTHGSLIVSLT